MGINMERLSRNSEKHLSQFKQVQERRINNDDDLGFCIKWQQRKPVDFTAPQGL